jgi:phage repressor protein C with HTH and peptisase S24 domain
MTRGIDPTSLIAVSVKGDSMTGVQIFEGDMVIFAQHHISENGIYVISLYGDLKVKRLEFRSGEQRIFIHSENSRYSTEEIPMNNDNLVIMGKVVGWIHCHPY